MSAEFPDYAVVSLTDGNSGKSLDARLPTTMPAAQLCVGIAHLLQKCRPDDYRSLGDISLRYCGQELEDNVCLADRGIWDGSRLEFVSSAPSTQIGAEKTGVQKLKFNMKHR